MNHHPSDFSVTVGHHRDTVSLAPAGDIDLATAPLVADHLEALAASGDVSHVLIDLQGVTFFDSTGVALLLGCWRRAEREGWELTIVNTPSDARGVLSLCGLLELLSLT
ncbi:STAS domain-containing protein [Baekduia sp.]|jgi:anti-anti-sigma factor|uniref:STAS domain-containing protein n=1 Tax=Baekduia sp. TaxID=2600305 RepID=UPI002E0337B4|nr:STAS domain-containing protein [Baekduia sp.]